MLAFKVNDKVILNTPDNDLLHGRVGYVRGVLPHFIEVSTDVGTGTYRAEAAELTHWAPMSDESSVKGYAGDVCEACQGSHVRRNGPCLLCDDCGATSGCS